MQTFAGATSSFRKTKKLESFGFVFIFFVLSIVPANGAWKAYELQTIDQKYVCARDYCRILAVFSTDTKPIV